jgi:hypothetical protein
MKTFRIWKSTGEPENIKANHAEFKREKGGLEIKFSGGLKRARIVTGVVAFTEILPPIIVERK